MAVTIQQIEKLRLQRGTRAVGVKIGEKWIFGFFEDERRVEACAEPFSEQRFTRADRTFNRDVAELQGAPMISSRRDAFDDRAGACPEYVSMRQRSSGGSAQALRTHLRAKVVVDSAPRR